MKKFKAFSIIEVALFLAIMGIAISLITPIWKAIKIHEQIKENEEKYEYIRLAMQAYLIEHGHLPNAANKDGIAIEKLYKGIVPYKTLGINKKYAKDSKNQYFIYAVNKNLCKINGKKYIPITMPFTIKPLENEITFCRFYEYANSKVENHDLLCKEPGLILLEKGISIIEKEDYIYIMHPTPGRFDNMESLRTWLSNSIIVSNETFQARKELQKNCNQIAWLLISLGKKTANDSECKKMNVTHEEIFCIAPDANDSGIFNDQIFYQTRFDMAAQINFPCTVEPILA